MHITKSIKLLKLQIIITAWFHHYIFKIIKCLKFTLPTYSAHSTINVKKKLVVTRQEINSISKGPYISTYNRMLVIQTITNRNKLFFFYTEIYKYNYTKLYSTVVFNLATVKTV